MARMATADRRLHTALSELPVTASGRRLLGDGAPWFEGWLEHLELSDPFWAPLNCEAALDRVTVPTLLVGGWQDLFIEQTLEQYRRLAGRGVPARLLVGPWAHLDLGTKGGAVMSLRAGTRDNRIVERRSDVLTFSSEPLAQPVDIIGEVTAELSVTRNNPHADLFVRLCDVDPRGRSRNVCDGIVRVTGADPPSGTTAVSLLGVAHRFRHGHRIRLQVSGGAHPRFARNPGTGQVDASPAELTPTDYRIGVLGESAVALPVVAAAGEPVSAGPLARSTAPTAPGPA
jgi:predicted acyl esterase